MTNAPHITQKDAKEVTELATNLRSLSYLIGAVAKGEVQADPDQLRQSLMSMQDQVQALNARLEELSENCQFCTGGSMGPECEARGCPLPSMRAALSATGSLVVDGPKGIVG